MMRPLPLRHSIMSTFRRQCIDSPTLLDLPDSVLNNILKLLSPINHNLPTETRACHCLTNKATPIREGETSIFVDTNSGVQSRQSSSPCRLDTGGLGSWCCKENLVNHNPLIPALAFTCQKCIKLYRNLSHQHTFVFCTEHCLKIAIRKLTNPTSMPFSKVVILECSTGGEKEAKFVTEKLQSINTFELHEGVMYSCAPDRQIIYSGNDRTGPGQEVWVKEMTAIGTEQ